MNLFEILRQHVARNPNAIASRSSRRTVTYRKFWSRIERGTARLKGEWNVRQGDTVVYWGCGHQDALMLYIATARCGARLLPLEHASLHRDSAAILQKNLPAVLLHDDEISFDTPPASPIVTNLSSLIATRCDHSPPVEEDDALPSLIMPASIDRNGRAASERSLQQLSDAAEGNVLRELHIEHALFDADIFAAKVLPILIAGGTIVFR